MSCCISAGGIVRLSIDGEIYHVRGSITLTAVNIEREDGANMDGSIYVTSKPIPPRVEATLSDQCGLSLSQMMNIKCVDTTLEFPEVGRTFILVNGIITGKPTLNPENGEISGFQMIGSSVREILEDPS